MLSTYIRIALLQYRKNYFYFLLEFLKFSEILVIFLLTSQSRYWLNNTNYPKAWRDKHNIYCMC